MKTPTYLASAGALLALMAFKQHFSRTDALVARQPVAANATKGTRQTATVADVVTAANAFLASLSAAQQGSINTTAQGAVLQPFNAANVIRWSNFPTGIYNNRLGLRLDAMTTAQKNLALAVVQAATGTTANEGFDEIQQLRAADDNLAANGGSSTSYGNGIYYLAFLGTPSTTGTWMLQYGGHHLATNITFGNGTVTGAAPKFEGVEPLTFTTTNSNVLPTGTTYSPQAQEKAGMAAMIAGLTTAQQNTAKLSQTFSDIVVGPQKDGQFPTTKVGLPCSQLTSAQQQLVMNAMAPWVNDSDDATAAKFLAYYQSQLANTYISYSGTGLFTSAADYARIDGPNVWIEFSCQNGIVYQNQIHYHTVWRDHASDYGGNFYGSYTTVLGTRTSSSGAAATVFTAFPNPVASGQGIDVVLAQTAKSASYTLRNSVGQQVASGTFSGVMAKVPTTGLAAGTYLLSVQPAGETAVTSRVTLQ